MTELRRTLPLPLVALYGLGVTIGAGIYVLLSATTARAGIHAPLSFVLAAIVMVFSATSYAELSTRYPVSAGEAAYVRAGLRSKLLSAAVGFLVVLSGIVSSAAISLGSTGYIREFIDLPPDALVIIVVVVLGAVAAWGIMESVLLASVFTVLEVGVLIYIIVVAIADNPALMSDMPDVIPAWGDGAAWAAVSSAGLLAFFAFIGFEDMVNLSEEVKEPQTTMPKAIFITLAITTIIYFMLTAVAVLSVPLDELAGSEAPLSFVFAHTTGASPVVITLIAIVATLNGVIIQVIMASRVLYGMAKLGSLPAFFAAVSPRTRTPLYATMAVTGLVLILALTAPLAHLAEWTSRVVLVVFALVNASLVMVKWRKEEVPQAYFRTWMAVPAIGFFMCVALLVGPLILQYLDLA